MIRSGLLVALITPWLIPQPEMSLEALAWLHTVLFIMMTAFMGAVVWFAFWALLSIPFFNREFKWEQEEEREAQQLRREADAEALIVILDRIRPA